MGVEAASGNGDVVAEVVDAPRTYIGAYALCVGEGRMLLARLSPEVRDGGKWTLPGGGLNWGEDPAEGVLRELEEETGLKGTVMGVAGVYSRAYPRSAERPRDSFQHLGIVFWVEAHEAEVRHEVGGSTDFCAWVPLEEVAGMPLVPLAEYAVEIVRGRS